MCYSNLISRLVETVMGETGTPWRWKYGDMRFWRQDCFQPSALWGNC